MEKITFLLKQHIGAPSTPIVSVGDNILRGQCIAEPSGLGAKLYSSVSGKVESINDMEIVVLPDDEQSEDYIKIKECDSILDTIYEAGIVGAGGAGFPTHVKLKANIPDGYIIANCVECEPALHHNIKLIEENPGLVIRGIRYTMEVTNAKKAYIGIKSKNEKAIKELKHYLDGDKNIEIRELKDIYPMGEERALIHAIFDKWLEPTQLPLEANCVVINAETLSNITRAVEDRKPVIDKDMTIVGKLNSGNEPHVLFQVPIGTAIKDLIEQCGGIDGEYGEVIIGGPYTGKAQELDSSVVTKTSGGVIVTIPFPKYEGPIGLLVCACGANEDRLRDVANKMGSEVVAVTKCKNVVEVKGANKCKTPGDCPGQAEGIINLKRNGAKRVLISNCSDCSNTVMCCAPKMGLPVYHHTDHVFRTLDYPLTRRLPLEENDSVVKSDLKEKTKDLAVLKYNKNAGEIITQEDLENPMHFEKLTDSLLVDLNEDVLLSKDVLDKKLGVEVKALTPITGDIIEGYEKEENGKSEEELLNSVTINGGVIRIKIGEGKNINLEVPIDTFK